MPNRVRFALPCLLLVAAALCGCHGAPPPPPAQTVTPIPTTPPAQQTETIPPAPASAPPIKDIAVAIMALTNSAPFPKGTQLVGVTVDAGVATINFSKEFSALANAGDSTESEAMKALQAALAKFPSVQKMRVTVAGKPFDSQNTDWNTPFAVRNGGASSSGAEGQGGGQ